jgi:hypothetical protein
LEFTSNNCSRKSEQRLEVLMPLQATSGAASYDAFGGGVPVVPTYIEDVMSTWLYTGNSGTQTITNGIDLSTKGGLVWIKQRAADRGHVLVDTVRGATKFLTTCNSAAVGNATDAEGTDTARVPSFTTSGFTLGADSATNSGSMVSWTFRKQPKFFDVVTYTGTGGDGRQISHSLGSTPGCIIVKNLTTGGTEWLVYHRSVGAGAVLVLNNTDPAYTSSNYFNTPTSTYFSVQSVMNASGANYVAYLFAHDAGGFGLTGTDNVISCGSCSTNGSGVATVNLGYEPQWLMVKRTDGANNWWMGDVMRGMTATGDYQLLKANSSDAEVTATNLRVSSTGFSMNNAGLASMSFIYIAIRRGPMKVPTSGTSVFGDISASVEPVSTNLTTESGVLTDLVVHGLRISDGDFGPHWLSRLTGNGAYLVSSGTAAEVTQGNFWKFDNNNFAYIPPSGYANNSSSGTKYVAYSFKRAPSFFDEVCYTGNNVSGRTITHNLAAVPELMIVKSRTSTTRDWMVYDATNSATNAMNLNNDSVTSSSSVWVSTAPTSTVFTVSDSSSVNDPAQNYVAYLFATCAGVSKVFSYTGNGSSQTINCGFTGGARFVLIKRTNAAGDWYVWDTARGIVSGNDSHLSLNSTVAEVTTDDTIDTDSTGFVVNQVSATNVNVSSANYIGLAIA